MKTLYILVIALLTFNVVNAQLALNNSWSRALLAGSAYANDLSADTIQKSITDAQADSLIKANANNDSFVIIDVRTADEYKLGHLQNSENIDFFDSNFNSDIDELDRDKMYLIYCGVGGRSGQTLNLMVSMKFREVYNMIGGYKKWKADGYPTEVDTATNIAENQSVLRNLHFYPNPATNQLILESNQQLNTATLSVYNLNGQELLKQPIIEHKSEINISDLPSGAYMIRFSNNQAVETGRFIKH